MKLTGKTVSELLAAFRSSDPTPGGGSASALAGAVGTSLLAMVAGLAKPRASSDEEASELRDAGIRCSVLASHLEALIDRDAEAYDVVVSAYRLAKGTDEEKAARAMRIQDALREATDAPLEVMRRCGESLAFATTIGRLGNPNAASDVQVAIYMLRAGLAGAAENVEINLGGLKDAEYVQRVRQEAATLAKRGSPQGGSAAPPNESAGANAPSGS